MKRSSSAFCSPPLPSHHGDGGNAWCPERPFGGEHGETMLVGGRVSITFALGPRSQAGQGAKKGEVHEKS